MAEHFHMHKTDAADLRNAIFQLFPSGEPFMSPNDVVPLENYDDDYVRDFFTAKTWKELASIDVLHGGTSSALSFLTSEAFVYFLPAFLVATLEDVDRADSIPDGIESRLSRDLKANKLLTTDQLQIVKQVISFCFPD